MNLVVIALIIVVIILLYFLYTYYYATTTTLSATADLKSPPASIPNDKLINSSSTRYSYAVWVYVNTWSSTAVKPLISRKNANGSTDFSLKLDASSPKLMCTLASSTTTPNADITITNNFPIQKWTYVIVSVDNQIVDCYLDGKLVISKRLESLPVVSQSAIDIGDATKPDIYLAEIVRQPKPMDPQTAWNNYLNGNGYANNTKYNIRLSLLQDNTELKNYSIF